MQKFWKGNLYSENRLHRNGMWCNRDCMRYLCAKGLIDLNFNKAVTDKKYQ